MKPFNLEEAIKGMPVITRDGREVTQLKFFEDVNLNLIVGVVSRNIWSWNIHGKLDSLRGDSDKDLFMAEEKKTIWINIWKNKVGYIFSTTHLREDRADIEIEEELEHTHLKKITTEL